MRKFIKRLTLVGFMLCLALGLTLVGCNSGTFAVNCEYDDTQGSVVLSAPASGGQEYAKGESVTVTVTPNPGNEVKSFSVNGDVVTDELQESNGAFTYTFSVTQDSTVRVSFKAAGTDSTFTLKTEFDDTLGNVTVSPSSATYAENAVVTITVTPNADCGVESVEANGVALSPEEDGTYHLTIQEDVTVTVTFVKYENTFIEEYIGSWKSVDGAYTLEISEHAISLTGEEGKETLENIETTIDDKFGDFDCSLTWNGKKYQLAPIGGPGTLALLCEDDGSQILFVPEPLPQISFAEEFYGEWVEATEGGAAEGSMLTIDENGATWPGHSIVLLSKEEHPEMGMYMYVALIDNTAIFQIMNNPGDEPALTFSGAAGQYVFLPAGSGEDVEPAPWTNGKGTKDEPFVPDSFIGSYPVPFIYNGSHKNPWSNGTSVWFKFTLEADGEYAFTSENYLPYVNFYQESNQEKPYWTWDAMMLGKNGNNQTHAFSAGTYLMKVNLPDDPGVDDVTIQFNVAKAPVKIDAALNGTWLAYDLEVLVAPMEDEEPKLQSIPGISPLIIKDGAITWGDAVIVILSGGPDVEGGGNYQYMLTVDGNPYQLVGIPGESMVQIPGLPAGIIYLVDLSSEEEEPQPITFFPAAAPKIDASFDGTYNPISLTSGEKLTAPDLVVEDGVMTWESDSVHHEIIVLYAVEEPAEGKAVYAILLDGTSYYLNVNGSEITLTKENSPSAKVHHKFQKVTPPKIDAALDGSYVGIDGDSKPLSDLLVIADGKITWGEHAIVLVSVQGSLEQYNLVYNITVDGKAHTLKVQPVSEAGTSWSLFLTPEGGNVFSTSQFVLVGGSINSALNGTYTARSNYGEGDPIPGVDDLVIADGKITWGDKEVTVLAVMMEDPRGMYTYIISVDGVNHVLSVEKNGATSLLAALIDPETNMPVYFFVNPNATSGSEVDPDM